MANVNCLEGMKCPECGSYEPFVLSVFAYTTMWDKGSESTTELEWDNDSYCKCVKCGHSNTVRNFDDSG
jgi:hypothetical protein